MATENPLRALIVEDSSDDVLLVLRALHQGGYAVSHQRVETEVEMHAALDAGPWDVVLCDYSMPRFDGMKALELLRTRENDTPFIFVSGSIGEETAVSAMRAGAQDYIMKDNLKRLAPAIARELKEVELRRNNHANEVRFRSVLNTALDAIVSIDEQRRILIFNKGAEAVFGYTQEEILGRPIEVLLPDRFAARHGAHVNGFGAENGPRARCLDVRRDVFGRRKDGSEFPAEITISKAIISGRITFTAILRDITERKHLEAQLDHLAHHDELTGLPNRRLLRVRMEQAMLGARRNGHQLAILLIDLDRFKTINDSLGHEAGDELIRQTGHRLQASVRAMDTVARLGGDEFAVLLCEVQTPENALQAGHKITEAFKLPFQIVGQELHVGASIGITLFPNDGENYETLFRNADIAMFRAKDHGGNRSQFYREGMTEQAVERLNLERDLRRAIGTSELELHYQPQLETISGRMVGAEALLRWTPPLQGAIGPDRFIPLAEQSGLIVPLGEWVLRTACAQAAAWRKAGLALRVAVNVSARQFREGGLADLVRQVLQDTGAAADWIEIEITESVLMLDTRVALDTLVSLRKAGIRLTMDDFGTGYSSLSYLKRFPVDTLKIDRSFVNEISTNQDDTAIISAIIAMAHHLNIEVVAEGVETQEQLDVLRQEGCDLVQGYFLHHPMPADRLTELLLSA